MEASAHGFLAQFVVILCVHLSFQSKLSGFVLLFVFIFVVTALGLFCDFPGQIM